MASGLGELRWRLHRRLGLLGFVRVGEQVEDLTKASTKDLVSSYGAGLRLPYCAVSTHPAALRLCQQQQGRGCGALVGSRGILKGSAHQTSSLGDDANGTQRHGYEIDRIEGDHSGQVQR